MICLMWNQNHPLLQKIWRKKFPHLPLGMRNYLSWQCRNDKFSPHYKLSVFSLNELGSQKENVGPLGFSSQIFIKISLCYGLPTKLPSIEKILPNPVALLQMKLFSMENLELHGFCSPFSWFSWQTFWFLVQTLRLSPLGQTDFRLLVRDKLSKKPRQLSNAAREAEADRRLRAVFRWLSTFRTRRPTFTCWCRGC